MQEILKLAVVFPVSFDDSAAMYHREVLISSVMHVTKLWGLNNLYSYSVQHCAKLISLIHYPT